MKQPCIIPGGHAVHTPTNTCRQRRALTLCIFLFHQVPIITGYTEEFCAQNGNHEPWIRSMSLNALTIWPPIPAVVTAITILFGHLIR